MGASTIDVLSGRTTTALGFFGHDIHILGSYFGKTKNLQSASTYSTDAACTTDVLELRAGIPQ